MRDLDEAQITDEPQQTALLYVDPKDYRPGVRKARQCYVRLPGKYRNKDRAWDALQDLMATRN